MSSDIISKDELDFATVYGCLFSLSTSVDYLIAITGMMSERKVNYIANKAKDAEKACNVVYGTLEREITKKLNPEQKQIALDAVEYHKETVYQFFLLEPDEQHRVRNLMAKIKKDRK